MKLLEDIRVETPLIGISKRKREGKDWVWIGKENSSNGWILQEEFDRIEKLKQQK